MTPLSDNLLDDLAAEAVREGLADAVYTRVKTPIGTLLVVSSDRGIVRLGFDGDPEDVLLADVAAGIGPRILRTDRELAGVRATLQEYLEGTREGDLDLPYDLRLVRSPFRRTVLETLARDVHRGDVIRYGELAARSGNPKAARAAGTACATNPVPIVVPCHRVLPSTGGVGSYGGGPPLKVRLLQLEGAAVTKGAPPSR
jgi:methylated-DNA-[protein]-cysteine S-methyltransferase